MAQIAHLVRIRAKPEDVYPRVASTVGIAEWFTEASSSDYREGGRLDLFFGEERVSFAITELTEPSRALHRRPTMPQYVIVGARKRRDGIQDSQPTSNSAMISISMSRWVISWPESVSAWRLPVKSAGNLRQCF